MSRGTRQLRWMTQPGHPSFNHKPPQKALSLGHRATNLLFTTCPTCRETAHASHLIKTRSSIGRTLRRKHNLREDNLSMGIDGETKQSKRPCEQTGERRDSKKRDKNQNKSLPGERASLAAGQEKTWAAITPTSR